MNLPGAAWPEWEQFKSFQNEPMTDRPADAKMCDHKSNVENAF